MYTSETYPQSGRGSQYNHYIVNFLRPSEIYPGEDVSLMGKLSEFTPAGIKQGSVGDCWFLAGTAAIAETPMRMHNLVHKNSRQDYNKNGVFRYFFWVENRWVPINIDDRLVVRYKYSNSRDYY